MHGGPNGELEEYGFEGEFVFNWTHKELVEKIDIGEGDRMPTLEELLIAVVESGRHDCLLNIELKAPQDEPIVPLYNHKLAAEIVCNLIWEYEMALCTMVSSFN